MNRLRVALAFVALGILIATTITVPITAQYGATLLKLSPDLEFILPAYNSSVGFSSWLYCNTFSWDDNNATTIVFEDAYMASGSPLTEVDVSVTEGNLTFNSLGRYGADFDIDQFGAEANVSLVGFGAEPSDVKVDGTLIDNYTYTSATDVLTVGTSGTNVAITFPSPELTSEDAIAIAVAFSLIVLGICIALVFVRRKNNDTT